MNYSIIKILPLILSILILLITNPNLLNNNHNLQANDILDCGLTEHFISFLNDKGYAQYKFNRTDIKCGSYGGKKTATQQIIKKPIIFIHGNSDVAFGRGTTDGYAQWQTGFRSLAAYLFANSYTKAQLYTTTWGIATPDNASSVYHSKQNLLYLRKFIQSVIQYTKSPQIIIIGHSMGVTLGRKVIKGGQVIDHIVGKYDLGVSLKDKVNMFIGLAGANYGLTACYSVPELYQTCNKVDGFYPGMLASSNPSAYLYQLNVEGGAEGKKVYTIWSKHDQLIGEQCIVWGRITCRIPNQDAEVIKTEKQWTHFSIRDNTGQDIIKWL